MTASPFLCLDLFAGAGGFSEGFRQAGFKSVVATDIDPSAGTTFDLNHRKHGTEFILGDISSPAIQEHLFSVVAGRELDAVIGGPPCQGFSQVRNHARLIDDPRNSLYRHYVAVIRKLRPKTFVMENVPGLENLGGGAVRQQILEDLSYRGRVSRRESSARRSRFGVPQNRQRILFIGVRANLHTEVRFPASPFENNLRGLLIANPHRTGLCTRTIVPTTSCALSRRYAIPRRPRLLPSSKPSAIWLGLRQANALSVNRQTMPSSTARRR